MPLQVARRLHHQPLRDGAEAAGAAQTGLISWHYSRAVFV